MRHGLVPLLTQAWLVACCTRTSPALTWISLSSSKHVNLAVENDRVIDGSGSVRIGVSRVTLRPRINTHRAQNFNAIDRRCLRARRSKIDNAENGAVPRWRHTDWRLRAVRRAGGVHRKFACDP